MKEKVLELVGQGYTDEHIANNLGISPGSVRAFRSHKTMGTYDKKNGESDSVIRDSLSLEADLKSHLLRNISVLDPTWRLHELKDEVDLGSVGRIDILAEASGNKVIVIELKAGTADDSALGQVLGYMGSVASGIGKGKVVEGCIVAHDFTERVRTGASLIKNLSLKAYEVNFLIKKVEI